MITFSWRARMALTYYSFFHSLKKYLLNAYIIAVIILLIVDIVENNTEEKKQKKRPRKTGIPEDKWKNIFKKEVIHLSCGTNRLGKMNTEDLLWDLTQRVLLVTLTTMIIGDSGGKWWLEKVQERIEEQGVETMSIDNSFEDFIVRKVLWSVLAAITKKSRISGL